MEESLAAREAVAKLTERYDRGADAYRELWAPVLRTAALPLVRALRNERATRILDVGTGVGALLPDLAAAFPRAFVLGVDRSRGMVGLAPTQYGRAVMDARELAIPSASVDCVSLLFMLFHLEHPSLALQEALRVLRSGGHVAALTWSVETDSRASHVWGECLDKHGAIPPDPAAETRHEAVDSPDKMEALLTTTGFAEVRAWVDDPTYTLDAEHLICLKTSLGSSKPRFDSLSPAAASACLEEARQRMRDLEPEDFVARGRVVYTLGSRR
jgi:SAM-dependent methyltransferase